MSQAVEEPVHGSGYGRGVFFVLLAGILWSTVGLGVRLIEDATAWQILLYRAFTLTPFIFLVLWVRSGGHPIAVIRNAGPSEAGISMGQAAFMTGIVWALPAQFVLIGAILAGASLPTAALAVALSSMRLLPMVASLVPEIRTRSTPTWLLLLLSHFVAVTSWVLTMQNLDRVPREGRAAFLAGFGLTIGVANVTLVAVCYGIIQHLPGMIGGALFFLTPVYFLTSIWATARNVEVYFALIIGLILGPVFHLADEELGLLLAGLIGGTLAFILQRIYVRFWPSASST